MVNAGCDSLYLPPKVKQEKKVQFSQILKSDDLTQNIFLEVKKPEIKETKGTFIPHAFKTSYWGPFSGLKSQDLIKISRTFPHGLFCPRSF